MLEGVKIIDMTSVVFGPFCTQILAEMGADVIKVEAPGGDIFRRAGIPPRTPGMGACHMTLNRGKRSVELDLKRAEDATLMRAMIADADIFIHNVRGRAIEALGFGHDALRAENPSLITVHCRGFGADGPYADLQAYDDVIQAATGMSHFAGMVDGDPRPRYVPSLIADKVAGMYGAQAVLGAYVHRLRTGQGQHVDVPMFECFTQFLYEEHLYGANFDPPTGPVGYPRQIDPARQPFPTKDGYISIVPYADASWSGTFALMGDPGFIDQPQFATPQSRAENVTQLYARIAELTPSRTTSEWMQVLTQARVPAMPVRAPADILDDPHLRETGFFQYYEHPTEGRCVAMRPPVSYGARRETPLRHAPGLGEHTDEIRRQYDTPCLRCIIAPARVRFGRCGRWKNLAWRIRSS
jgi:crotonobetainyl-CoA:carnitine CoA-transferase CaiB-like acyl-CoA transferase